MYLSRVAIDSHNRKKIRDLTHLGAFHNWIESSFPGEIEENVRSRKLWRIDRLQGKDYLLLVSEEKPDLTTKEQVQKELEVYEYYLDHPDKWAKRRKLQITKNRLCQKNKLFAKIYGKVKKKNLIDVSKSYESCCVQGACIVVSKEYLEKEEKMFSPEPFLYCEEIFLYAKCLKKGYKIVYDPTIQIWHEDSSTIKKISGDAVAKAKFTLPNHVKARKMLVEYLDV